jgi:hypothetical protein
MVYAAIALASIVLYLEIPEVRYEPPQRQADTAAETSHGVRQGRVLAALLYASSATLANFANSAMSAHMIGILIGLGLASGVAVSIATLRGIGQSAARLCEILFGGKLHPFDLNIIASLALPVAFAAGLFGAGSVAWGAVFALLYGAGNGLLTIARGTLPLVLFDPRQYGAIAGGLLAPSFLLAAAAPLACASLAENLGEQAVLYLSLGLGCAVLACAVALRLRFGGR